MSIFDKIDTSGLSPEDKDAVWMLRKLYDMYKNAKDHEKAELKRKMEEASESLSFLNFNSDDLDKS